MPYAYREWNESRKVKISIKMNVLIPYTDFMPNFPARNITMQLQHLDIPVDFFNCGELQKRIVEALRAMENLPEHLNGMRIDCNSKVTIRQKPKPQSNGENVWT